MASFPVLKRAIADDRQPDTGLSIAYAPDGGQFGQSLYGEEYWVFNPVFVNMSQAEADTLLSFYKDNKLLAFDFEYAHRGLTSVDYECHWLSPGVKVVPQESGRYMAQAFFRGRVKP